MGVEFGSSQRGMVQSVKESNRYQGKSGRFKANRKRSPLTTKIGFSAKKTEVGKQVQRQACQNVGVKKC